MAVHTRMTRKHRAHGATDAQTMSPDEGFLQHLTGLRRRLHEHPENGFEEHETARILTQYLAEAGLEPVAKDIAGTGLLYHVKGGEAGPKVMLEADLDALPLTEDTGKEYASKNEGTHHACGHDGHMAMLAGALVRLHEQRNGMPGEVYAFFQPAEETGQGAMKVMQDPRVRELDLDGVFSIHNLPGCRLGSVVIRPGAMASASVGLHFRFLGESSHAAAPYKGKSAAPALAQLTLKAPSVPSEVLPYGRPGLVTVIQLEAGQHTFGTAAGSGSARFTLRGAKDEELRAIRERLVEHAEALAQAHSLGLEVEEVEPFPATVNDPDAVKAVEAAARRLELEIDRPAAAQPWSEDFGHFNAKWPGALICLGSGVDQPELHRPDFDFPDGLLKVGVDLWVALIMKGIAEAGQEEKKGQGVSTKHNDEVDRS